MRRLDLLGQARAASLTETSEVTPEVQSDAAITVVPLGPPRTLHRPSSVPAGATRAIDLRAKAVLGKDPLSGPVDGVTYCQTALAQIRKIKEQDPTRRCVVVFDIDNTIFETRARTLLALRAYDAKYGTSHFSSLQGPHDVGIDAKHTAELLSVPKEELDRIHEHWLEYFWKGENFLQDEIIEPIFDLAWQAKNAGAEVLYLTGRIDHVSTLTQLMQAGLPDTDRAHLFCKQNGQKTEAFKVDALKSWLDQGDFIGWFVTEGVRDIAAVQAGEPRAPCVRLGFPYEDGAQVDPSTPYLPEDWVGIRRPIPSAANES